MSDPINPSHYRFKMADGRVFEAIDVIRAVLPPEQLIGYCRGTKLAYELRAGRKPGSPLIQDEMKGQWFGEYLIDFLVDQAWPAKPGNGHTKAASDGQADPAALVLAEVTAELQRARSKFPPMRSPHEAWGIIAEEFTELTEEIRRQKPDRAAMRREAAQLAAMCARLVIDLLPEVAGKAIEHPDGQDEPDPEDSVELSSRKLATIMNQLTRLADADDDVETALGLLGRARDRLGRRERRETAAD